LHASLLHATFEVTPKCAIDVNFKSTPAHPVSGEGRIFECEEIRDGALAVYLSRVMHLL
jgi:hypothetical protein